jgi:hypothetical protein
MSLDEQFEDQTEVKRNLTLIPATRMVLAIARRELNENSNAEKARSQE